jgi:integrase
VFPFETWEGVEAIAAELDARYRAIPVFAAGTGLRPEELFGLRREDIDRERRRIHVRRRYTQRVLKPGTKTEAERFVPFGARVLAALDAMPVRIDTPVLSPPPGAVISTLRSSVTGSGRLHSAQLVSPIVASTT